MSTSANVEPKATRRVRQDVLRNRQALVDAARLEFAERGIWAPLETIAKRAGLGVATLYRHFPDRCSLVDTALTCELQTHLDVALHALETEDPWEGLVQYLQFTGEAQAQRVAMNDLLSMNIPGATQTLAVKARLKDVLATLLAHAQRAGHVRRDVTVEDLLLLPWANTRVMTATYNTRPDAWRRLLELFLAGIRVGDELPFQTPPLTATETYDAMSALGEMEARGAPSQARESAG